jgi:hypothetical protein
LTAEATKYEGGGTKKDKNNKGIRGEDVEEDVEPSMAQERSL